VKIYVLCETPAALGKEAADGEKHRDETGTALLLLNY